MKSNQQRRRDVPAKPMRVNTPASVGAFGGGEDTEAGVRRGGEDVTGLVGAGLFVEIPELSASKAILLNIQRAQGALEHGA